MEQNKKRENPRRAAVQNFPFSCLEGAELNATKLRVLSFLVYQT